MPPSAAEQLRACACRAAGDRVYLGLRDGHVAVYDALGGELLHLFRANAADREVTSLAVRESGGGVLVVAGCEHGSQAIRVIELAQFGSGKARPKPALLANHDTFHPVVALALSPDGGQIAAMGSDEELEVWAPTYGDRVVPRVAPEMSGLAEDERGEDIQYAKDGRTRLVW